MKPVLYNWQGGDINGLYRFERTLEFFYQGSYWFGWINPIFGTVYRYDLIEKKRGKPPVIELFQSF